MISIELIRNDPKGIAEALAKRGDSSSLQTILTLDTERRQLISSSDNLKAIRNEVSKKISQIEGKERDHLIVEMRKVGKDIDEYDQKLGALQEQLHRLLLELPNLPMDDVPLGKGEEENIVVREWGTPIDFDFTPLPHWELGEKLKIIDFQRGAKLAGSRFYVQVGFGARLERAIINFMLDQHVNNHGYTEMQLPSLVTEDVMEGSGNLPKFGDNLYKDNPSELWMIPTAEVPLTGLHRDEILPPGSLPKYYTSFTQCFRREKTAAGRDTRGIKRVHQFNKVELYKFVEPSTAGQEFEKLVSNAEQICRLLELPYRILELCTGDLGFASSKTFDIEVWAPGSQEWLEVSSCSNCADFQSRRSNIRYRHKDQAALIFPYTLNGSGLALPRVIIALLENGQQKDGSITLPEILHPYTGFATITSPQA